MCFSSLFHQLHRNKIVLLGKVECFLKKLQRRNIEETTDYPLINFVGKQARKPNRKLIVFTSFAPFFVLVGGEGDILVLDPVAHSTSTPQMGVL